MHVELTIERRILDTILSEVEEAAAMVHCTYGLMDNWVVVRGRICVFGSSRNP
jgi:hypothetical protein